jgi:UrcA family protein
MNTTETHRTFGFGKTLMLGVAGLLVALSGQAAERVMLGTNVTSVTVAYDDLNLSSPNGAKALYARLESAASKVCGGEPNLLQELQKHSNFRSCYHQALDNAVDKVADPRLQALHREQVAESRMS